ncbi:MAG TPA: hypothetical protein VFK58_01585 [Sphingomicrobium sp.]|nr:hypothetical protein [Sphingomicrobium sp.]
MPAATLAQSPPGNAQIVQEIDACRAIADPTQRLACFDRTAAALVTATRNREVVVLDEKEVKRTERSLFGFSLPRIPFFGGGDKDGKPAEAKPKLDSIESRITGIAQAGYGKWAFALADGSRWQTIEMDTKLRPRVGDPIVIERAALGSFRASINGAGLVRIRRTG